MDEYYEEYGEEEDFLFGVSAAEMELAMKQAKKDIEKEQGKED